MVCPLLLPGPISWLVEFGPVLESVEYWYQRQGIKSCFYATVHTIMILHLMPQSGIRSHPHNISCEIWQPLLNSSHNKHSNSNSIVYKQSSNAYQVSEFSTPCRAVGYANEILLGPWMPFEVLNINHTQKGMFYFNTDICHMRCSISKIDFSPLPCNLALCCHKWLWNVVFTT